MKKEPAFLWIFLLILAGLLFLPPAGAQSISVSPDRLYFHVNGSESERQLAVYNGNAGVMRIRIAADEFPEWFSFDRSEVEIPPGKFEKVKVSVSPDAANGEYVSHLTVIPAEDGNKLTVQLGAVVAAVIMVDKENKLSTVLGVAISSAIVTSGLAAYFLLKRNLNLAKN